MKVADAISLITPAVTHGHSKGTWADLGCGSGIFTMALAAVLGPAAKIYAVDKESQTLSTEIQGSLQFLRMDFVEQQLPFFDLDGILMANALHYVKDQHAFLQQIGAHLTLGGQMIIVEYDTEKQNRWVPYPVSFKKLQLFCDRLGVQQVKKVGERPSIYQSGKMYCASVTW